MARFRRLDPDWRITNVEDWLPLRRPEDLARLEDGLRKARLPKQLDSRLEAESCSN